MLHIASAMLEAMNFCNEKSKAEDHDSDVGKRKLFAIRSEDYFQVKCRMKLKL